MALVNGQGYDFSSMTCGLLGNPLVIGFKAISYGVTRQKVNNKGAQGDPVERTRGDKDYQGSLTLSLKEVMRIRAAGGNRPLTDLPPFPITISYANGVDPVTTDICEYVEFMEDVVSASSGDTEIPVTLPFLPGGIRYNV